MVSFFWEIILNPIAYTSIIYFGILLGNTIFKQYITSRGIFYSLTFCLLGLLSVLVSQLDLILLNGVSYSWEGVLLNNSLEVPEIGLSLYMDFLSYTFTFLVVIIGLGTNIYALNYFKHEANEDSFILLLNWFILSMILLVLANNLFTLFLGWELIGLTSFFLINFWSNRRGTLKASFKAFVFNKVSDFFLFVFMVLLWYLTEQSNLTTITATFHLTLNTSDIYWFICGYMLIFCSAIKSAQLIGHLWLPDSMEAPVPASALIHSATLVSAGVYLLLRFQNLLTLLDIWWVVTLLGALTAAYGGIVAAAQTDVKKLLAYSTISHCGFLFVCTSFTNTYLVIVYLFLHGLFKALTFFCVGSFIRVSGSQDTRQMGSLSRIMPFDTVLLIICGSNLGGLPFTLGYLYKYLFMNLLVVNYVNAILVGFLFIGMLSSLVYVYRLVYYCAFDINKTVTPLNTHFLQSHVNLKGSQISYSTIVQGLAVYLLLAFAIYIYVIFYSYSSQLALTLDYQDVVISSLIFTFKIAQFYTFYIYVFYALYVLVGVVILILECRRSYTWVRKILFLLYILAFLLFLSFIFNFLL